MVILVIGTHRCGSSCVAGILHHAGLFMGYSLIKPAPMNPRGFFEDTDFVNLAVNINQNGLKDQYHQQIKKMVKRRDKDHDLWGIKMPGLCWHAKTIAPYLADYKVVVVERDPWAVVRSNIELMRKNKPEKRNSIESIAKITNNIHESIKARRYFLEHIEKPVFRIRYEQLLKKPKIESNRLIEFAGLNPTEEQLSRVWKFITPKLNHH